MSNLVSELGSFDSKNIVHLGQREDDWKSEELRSIKNNTGLDNMSCILLIKE
jgi:hypothetical protein